MDATCGCNHKCLSRGNGSFSLGSIHFTKGWFFTGEFFHWTQIFHGRMTPLIPYVTLCGGHYAAAATKKWRNYPAVYSFTHQYGMTRRNFAKTFSIEKI